MLSTEKLYIQVVETGSFKQAAEQLNLEPSSVSRKIAALESRLKVKLLRRSTQRTSPTELGQAYYERLRRIVDEQTALEEDISSGVNRLSGNLRISAPVDFGTRFVVPVVRDLQRLSQELSIELILGSQFDNILEMHLDVAVRIGELSDSNLIAKRLGNIDRVLVASKDYLQKHGTPKTISDLELHNFILYSPTQARSDIEFSDGSRFSHLQIKSNITVNSVTAVRNLVSDGMGIHLGPKWAFQDQLMTGQLVQLLPGKPLRSFPVHSVYLSRSYLPFKISEFNRLLSENLFSE